ncbi:MAG TPA: ATP-binding protein [Casimicrobiaceae bacterium]
MTSAAFKRSFDSIPEIFALTADTFAREGIDPRLLPTVDLALEELFTNMVKYSTTTTAPVQVEIVPIAEGVEVTLIDRDVEPFDVTKAPDVDVSLPIDQRDPGGLGLHLIRRMLDSIEYEYTRESRRSRITFRKIRPGAGASGRVTNKGGTNASD